MRVILGRLLGLLLIRVLLLRRMLRLLLWLRLGLGLVLGLGLGLGLRLGLGLSLCLELRSASAAKPDSRLVVVTAEVTHHYYIPSFFTADVVRNDVFAWYSFYRQFYTMTGRLSIKVEAVERL